MENRQFLKGIGKHPEGSPLKTAFIVKEVYY